MWVSRQRGGRSDGRGGGRRSNGMRISNEREVGGMGLSKKKGTGDLYDCFGEIITSCAIQPFPILK
jgi:hypothetical protein